MNRYNNTNRSLDTTTGKYTYDIWTAPKISLTNSTNYRIEPGYAFRPDLIAWKFYRDPLLAWALQVANLIFEPFDEETGFYAGRTIKIPRRNNINV